MGRIGVRFLGVALVLGGVAGRSAQAESTLTSMLALITMGATQTENSRDYGDLIGVDPNVTVRLAGESGHCTATFISPTRVVTAAHCINPQLDNGGVNIDGIPAVAAHAHPGFIYPKKPGFLERLVGAPAEEEAELNAFDIAVAEFPQGTAAFLGVRHFPPIAQSPLEKGHGYLAGYGIDDFFSFVGKADYTGAGLLGWGVMNIAARKDGFLETDMETIFLDRSKQKKYNVDHVAYSHALPGDSGGAVYNDKGEIVGIVSAMLYKGDEDVVGTIGPIVVVGNRRFLLSNYIIDITSPSSRDEIEHEFETLEKPTEATVRTVSMTSEDTEPSRAFDKMLIRTGQYALDKEVVGLIPRYRKGKLSTVVLYEKLGTPSRVANTYECTGVKCFRTDLQEMIEVKGTRFTRFALEPEEKAAEPIVDHRYRVTLTVNKELGTYTLK